MNGESNAQAGDGGAMAKGEEALAKRSGGKEDGEYRPAVSLESAKQLILEKAQIRIGDHDPVLMLVVLHEGFIKDYDALLKRHHQAMKTVMEREVGAVVEKMGEVAERFGENALKGSMSRTLEEVAVYEKRLQNLRNELVNDLLSALRTRVAWGILWHGILTFVTAGAAIATVVALAKI